MTKPVKVVIALGGNALEEKGLPPTSQSQMNVVSKTSEYIAELSACGYELAIVHGNGPQVGRILLATEAASHVTPALPFDVCGAMSQGYIGYHIQQALRKSLEKRNRHLPVVTVITQMVVDEHDPAFESPAKPIGPFYTEAEARALENEKGYVMKEDAGRGFRRVVASPEPLEIVEIDTIKTLWDSTITVTCGGGGIPVVRNADGSLRGVAAVIDKDLAAERLAEGMEADILMILTEVEQVCLYFNTPDQKALGHITAAEAKQYVDEGHFAPGSMLPKMQAAIRFAESKAGRKAIITSLYKAEEALAGRTGTVIEG
ncbi:MAG: carbamate kinase [Peptococcaceae bacterium]|nr:carbamate kinase [Peptococcaceae bacterium]